MMRITFDTSTTGLSPGFTIKNADGTTYAARTTSGITHEGGGVYSAQVADGTLAGRYVVWDTGESSARYASETFPANLNSTAAGTPTYYAPSVATRTVGTDQGGTVATLAAHDDNYFSTGELGTGAYLDVVLDFATSATEAPLTLDVVGYYNGSAVHNIVVSAYNYVNATWEPRLTMLTRTTPFDYAASLTADHFDGSGACRIRFQHNANAGQSSHRLHLDMVRVGKVLAVDRTPADVAAIRAQTDQLVFVQGEVAATLGSDLPVGVSMPAGWVELTEATPGLEPLDAAGVTVMAYSGATLVGSDVTGVGGTFVIPVPTGTYTVKARRSGYSYADKVVTV